MGEYKMNGVIYVHILKEDGRAYVGQTKIEPNRRWRTNGEGYKNSPKFYNAIEKYGWNSFEHIILEQNIYTQEKLNLLEKKYVNLYNSIENGFNLTTGGEKNYFLSEETKNKISVKLKGRPLSEQTKEKLSQSIGHRQGQSVYCKEINTIFNCTADAADYLINNNIVTSNRKVVRNTIYRAASGIRITAYGYHWKYIK